MRSNSPCLTVATIYLFIFTIIIITIKYFLTNFRYIKDLISNMPSVCEFRLRNENIPFICGQDNIEGRIFLRTTSVKNVKAINIMLRGKTKCRYTADSDYIVGDPDSQVAGTNYVSLEHFLTGTNIVQSEGILPVGLHTWSFNFNLPYTCATSLESELGHIRYELSLNILNKDKYNNTFVKPISVLRLFNFKIAPNLEHPLQCGVDTDCNVGLTKGKLLFNLSVAHGGYTPGERLRYTLIARNKTGPTIDFYEVKFIKKTKFIFTTPQYLTKYVETVLYKRDILHNGQVEQMTTDVFVVPSTPPTTYTKLINVDYILRAKAMSMCTAAEFKTELPIVIGTEPAEGRDLRVTVIPATNVTQTEPDSSTNVRKVSLCFERAHPTEPPFDDEDADELCHAKDFQPLYPVYDIKIIFLGEGKVKWQNFHWITDFTNPCPTFDHYYRSHEVYVSNTTLLYGDGILPMGTYTFTFNIDLPPDCPTSFEGKYGRISYTIALNINRYFRASEIFKQPVNVVRGVNLNLNPAYKKLLAVNVSRSLGCWPFSTGKIVCRLQIPASAYTPGQLVNYTIHVFNQSMDDATGYLIDFTKKISFIAKSPSYQERSTEDVLLWKVFPSKCLRQTNRIIKGGFKIPQGCKATEKTRFIILEYFLRVKIRLNRYGSNINLVAPVIIGTASNFGRQAAAAAAEPLERTDVLENTLQMSGAMGTDIDLPPRYDQLTADI